MTSLYCIVERDGSDDVQAGLRHRDAEQCARHLQSPAGQSRTKIPKVHEPCFTLSAVMAPAAGPCLSFQKVLLLFEFSKNIRSRFSLYLFGYCILFLESFLSNICTPMCR